MTREWGDDAKSNNQRQRSKTKDNDGKPRRTHAEESRPRTNQRPDQQTRVALARSSG